MRLLGVDLGGTRIGIATADSVHKIPSSRPPLAASGTLLKDAEAILKIAQKEEAELIVVGLPLNEGEETKMSRICRMLAEKLSGLGAKVATIDESFTSMRAEDDLRAEGLKASQVRKAVDGEAAMRILMRYMESND